MGRWPFGGPIQPSCENMTVNCYGVVLGGFPRHTRMFLADVIVLAVSMPKTWELRRRSPEAAACDARTSSLQMWRIAATSRPIACKQVQPLPPTVRMATVVWSTTSSPIRRGSAKGTTAARRPIAPIAGEMRRRRIRSEGTRSGRDTSWLSEIDMWRPYSARWYGGDALRAAERSPSIRRSRCRTSGTCCRR